MELASAETEKGLDSETLAFALETLIVGEYAWNFLLYAVTKTIDGKQLEFARVSVGDLEGWAESVRSYMAEKAIRDRPVLAFRPQNPKEAIGAITEGDPSFKPQLTDAILSIENAQEWAALDLGFSDAKWVGHAIYGKAEDGRKALFIKRSNPMQASARSRLYIATEDGMQGFDDAVMKIPSSADFLLLDGCGYFFSEAVSKDFDLESRDRAQAVECLKLMEGAGFLSDISYFQEIALKPKHMKKFRDFDEKIMEHIQRLEITERMDYLSRFSIELDKAGAVYSSADDACEAVIDLLTCRSCLDVLGRLAYGKIAPKE